jgi:hypothetical protein
MLTLKQKHIALHNYLADLISRQPQEQGALERSDWNDEKKFTALLYELMSASDLAVKNYIKKIHDW